MLVACAGGSAPGGPPLLVQPKARATSSAKLAPAPVESSGHHYELTRGSVRLLGTLKSPIHIDAYVMWSHPILAEFSRDLEAVLEEYERASGGKLSYALI